jgi:hypothetical protein
VWSTGGIFSFIHFSHGHPNGSATATAPNVADGRRFNRSVTSTPAAGDPFAGVDTGDELGIEAGALFEDAVLVAGTVEDGSNRGTFVAVGNYTAADGLSGSGGTGSQLDIVFCDRDVDFSTSGSPSARTADRVREWSVSSFALRSRNEILFTVVDYLARDTGDEREGFGMIVRATRTAPGSPWTFERPVIVHDYDINAGINHTQGHWLALVSDASATESAGTLSSTCNVGDTPGRNACYHRYITDPDQMERHYYEYSYGSLDLEVAFAETPTVRWQGLTSFAEASGSAASAWSAERDVSGRRTADGASTDWGSLQLIGSCIGPTKNICYLGGDVSINGGIYEYDADAWDFDTGYPAYRPIGGFGPLSNLGYSNADGSDRGFNAFTMYVDNQWSPSLWAFQGSQFNLAQSANLKQLVGLGIESGGRVRFGVVRRINGVMTAHPYTLDGATHIMLGTGGASPDIEGIHTLTFNAAPTVATGRLLGAGHDNYKALHNAQEAGAGSDQSVNAGLFEFNTNTSQVPAAIDAAFATDAEVAALEAAIGMPATGPIFRVSKDEGVSTGARGTNLYCQTNKYDLAVVGQMSFNNHTGGLNVPVAHVEMLFYLAFDPLGVERPRTGRWTIRLGDRTSNPFVGGSDCATLDDFYMASGPCWIPFRISMRDASTMANLHMRVIHEENDGTSGGTDEVYETYMMIAAVTVYPQTEAAAFYPIGYSGPSNVAALGFPAVTNGGDGVYLPDEQQSVTLPSGDTGTVTYRLTNPHDGVDFESYQPRVTGSVNADHAFFSLVEDASNYVEVGYRNGRTLYAKWRAGGSETVTLGDNDIYLHRGDQITVSVRYSGSSCVVDVFNGGEQTTITLASAPAFADPVARCGSHNAGRTIPVIADTVGYFDTSLSSGDLAEAARAGTLAAAPARTPGRRRVRSARARASGVRGIR